MTKFGPNYSPSRIYPWSVAGRPFGIVSLVRAMNVPPPELRRRLFLFHNLHSGITIKDPGNNEVIASFPTTEYPMQTLLSWCQDRHLRLEHIVFQRDTGIWEFSVQSNSSRTKDSPN